MTISAAATAAAPSNPASLMIGTGTSADAGDSSGFAEQFQGFKAANPTAVPLTPAVKVTSIKVAADGEQPPDAAEPADNTTGAAMLAALLFGVGGAVPTTLPIQFRFTGDSLPPVKTANGTGTPPGKPQLLSGVTGAQGMAMQVEVAAAQAQQMPVALREGVQPQATAQDPQTVPLPAAPAEAGPESPDLAFAARLKPGPATQTNSPALSPSNEAIPRITAIAELRRPELDDGRNQNTVQMPAQQMANSAVQTFITSDGPGPLGPANKPSTPAAPETRAVAPEAPVKSTGPLKELSLQVGNQNQDRVEVRMVERGGELHVAVRTGSTDLAHGLREGISDLVSRLQETGFRTETWRPVHAAGSVSAASGPEHSATTQFRNNSDSQSNPGGSQQQPRDQRDQHQSNRPSWVEEMEGSLVPTGEPTPGGKHGFIR